MYRLFHALRLALLVCAPSLRFPPYALALSGAFLSTLALPPTSVAAHPLAEALYQEGKRLMAEGRYGLACPKFRESQRLDPGLGTLLNLATCHEKEGKLATAWTEYHEAAAWARRTAEHERAQFADAQLALLQPRLSYLTLSIADPNPPKDLEVFVDGREIGAAAFGLPMPLDRGAYLIEAKAPGKKTFSENLALVNEGQNETLSIPALDNAPPPPVPRLTPATPKEPIHRAPRLPLARPITTPIVVSASATLALALAAGVTGYLYLDRREDFDAANSNPLISRQEREELRSNAKTHQLATGALTGAALTSAALTAYLYFARPEKALSVEKAAVLPVIGYRWAGVRVRWGAQ